MRRNRFAGLVATAEEFLQELADQMSEEDVLEVRKLKRAIGDRVIIATLSFTVRRGDILFVRGPSGVGKSLLLRALAYLDPIQVKILMWIMSWICHDACVKTCRPVALEGRCFRDFGS